MPQRALSLITCALILSFTVVACDSGSSTQAESERPSLGPGVEETVGRLVEVFTPLDPTLTSDHHDRQLWAQREMLDELRLAPRAIGLQALRIYEDQIALEEPQLQVCRTLLDVAAHAAPEDLAPRLEQMIQVYGESYAMRSEAPRLLAAIAPERAVAVLEPILKGSLPHVTLPPAEFLVEHYARACESTGHDSLPVLCMVATDLRQDPTARYVAVEWLGKYSGSIPATQALQAILIESTGDGYLRRKAAQAVRDILAPEQACTIFESVALREADLNFLRFLQDMLQDHCGRTLVVQPSEPSVLEPLEGLPPSPSSTPEDPPR